MEQLPLIIEEMIMDYKQQMEDYETELYKKVMVELKTYTCRTCDKPHFFNIKKHGADYFHWGDCHRCYYDKLNKHYMDDQLLSWYHFTAQGT
jgi:hypothetical protein